MTEMDPSTIIKTEGSLQQYFTHFNIPAEWTDASNTTDCAFTTHCNCVCMLCSQGRLRFTKFFSSHYTPSSTVLYVVQWKHTKNVFYQFITDLLGSSASGHFQ